MMLGKVTTIIDIAFIHEWYPTQMWVDLQQAWTFFLNISSNKDRIKEKNSALHSSDEVKFLLNNIERP